MFCIWKIPNYYTTALFAPNPAPLVDEWNRVRRFETRETAQAEADRIYNASFDGEVYWLDQDEYGRPSYEVRPYDPGMEGMYTL